VSFETFISWRYLKAKRSQTFISLITVISMAGVALGVTALIVVLAVMNGFQEDLKTKILGVNSHIVVLRTKAPLEEYTRLMPIVSGIRGVSGVEPFIYSQVMVSALGGASGMILRGVDPELAGKAETLPQAVKQGRLDSLESGPSDSDRPARNLILGAELARQLGVLVGDTVKVISPSGRVTPLGGRAPSTREFKVTGLFQSGMYEYDSMMAYVSLAQAQDFLNLGRSVTGLEVRVDDIYRADRIREAITAALGSGYTARDWMQMNRSLFSALKLEKTAMFIILILTVMVAAFNIIATLIMVVMEKTREIAILKSMGATSRSVMKIFVFQGLFIGLVGTAAGLAGGLSICGLLARYEIVKLPTDVFYISTVPVRLETFDVGLITLSALALSLLATLYPAWQASRLHPVEALRYE